MGKISKLLFSDVIVNAEKSKKIAYTGVLTAFAIICNMFSISLFDVQFSLTIFASVLCGVFLGGGLGFVVCFLADLLGWLINSQGGLYMPWVGLSTAFMAFIGGAIVNNGPKGKVALFVKTAIVCLAVLLICTIGINTTGFYIYYTKIGFSPRSMGFINDKFGGNVTYFTYAIVRLLFMGQLINSLVNYALLFIALPLFAEVEPLKRFF